MTARVSPLARHVAAARKPKKAAEQLADEILGYIVDRGLVPGTRLAPERQMLADTGRARDCDNRRATPAATARRDPSSARMTFPRAIR